MQFRSNKNKIRRGNKFVITAQNRVKHSNFMVYVNEQSLTWCKDLGRVVVDVMGPTDDGFGTGFTDKLDDDAGFEGLGVCTQDTVTLRC